MLALQAFSIDMAKSSIIDFLFEKPKPRKKGKVYAYGDIGRRIMSDDPSTYPDKLTLPRRKKNR